MSGTVGIISDATARYSAFTNSILHLKTPVNTVKEMLQGSERAFLRNELVSRSLERGSEWMFFLDDDQTFPPDILLRLLAHDVPVCSGLYLQRNAPFLPVAFESKEGDNYNYLDLSDKPDKGLVPIVGCGAGALLIRSEVFHAIDPPWFLYSGKQSEDLHFCNLALDAGFPIYLDLGARIGHMAAINVFPINNGVEWTAGLSVSSTMHVEMPIGGNVDPG